MWETPSPRKGPYSFSDPAIFRTTDRGKQVRAVTRLLGLVPLTGDAAHEAG